MFTDGTSAKYKIGHSLSHFGGWRLLFGSCALEHLCCCAFIYALEHLCICALEHLGIWAFGRWCIWAFEHYLCIWAFEHYLCTCAFGQLCTWAFVQLCTWAKKNVHLTAFSHIIRTHTHGDPTSSSFFSSSQQQQHNATTTRQANVFVPELTARETLEFYGQLHGAADAAAFAEQWLQVMYVAP